jgi:acetyl esterase/lipase
VAQRIFIVCLFLLASLPARAQLSEAAIWAVEAETRYQFQPNVTYVTADGIELKLDIYSRRDVTTPQPTLMFFHGGFWVAGSKDNQLTALLPWLEKGWNVVNVGYRLGGTAPAPAAVVDAFHALRYVYQNAAMYNIDVNRIVTSGQSAGGHLALALGMVGAENFDRIDPAVQGLRVAAVINWYGVADVADVIAGEHRSEAAARWFAGMDEASALALAGRLSPLRYVRDGLPPILTIQGDADMVVPYAQGMALHQALSATNASHRLLTIPGGGHGRFTAAERQRIYVTINEFLRSNGLE